MPPSTQEMNRFVATVDKFMQKLAQIDNPQMRQLAYASNDQALIDDYEIAIGRGRGLKATIEATTGAWNTAKRTYASVTDQTSMIIGDWIDDIRGWFRTGPKADLGVLGILQFPAAAWIAGIVGSAFLIMRSMDAVLIRLDASRIQRENPNISRDQAIAKARAANAVGSLFSFDNAPLLIGGALALWLLLR